ncbi:hypothetical protein JCM8097_009151 [Rhodosporidiobolus ruineniae]
MVATKALHTEKAAGAFSGSNREDAFQGNTSAAGGAGGQFTGPTTSEDVGSLGNDFSLRGVQGEREGDLVEPNALAGDMASTAGPGGDFKHREPGEHELKGMKQRLERDDERADREARGYDEPISRLRLATDRGI